MRVQAFVVKLPVKICKSQKRVEWRFFESVLNVLNVLCIFYQIRFFATNAPQSSRTLYIIYNIINIY